MNIAIGRTGSKVTGVGKHYLAGAILGAILSLGIVAGANNVDRISFGSGTAEYQPVRTSFVPRAYIPALTLYLVESQEMMDRVLAAENEAANERAFNSTPETDRKFEVLLAMTPGEVDAALEQIGLVMENSSAGMVDLIDLRGKE